MPEEDETTHERRAPQSAVISVASIETSQTVGNQTWSLEVAEFTLKSEESAEQRLRDRMQLQHDLDIEKQEKADKLTEAKHRRLRENITYGIVAVMVVLGLIASFWIAATATDPSRQTWAQGIVTSLAGAAAGALFGYMTGKGK